MCQSCLRFLPNFVIPWIKISVLFNSERVKYLGVLTFVNVPDFASFIIYFLYYFRAAQS